MSSLLVNVFFFIAGFVAEKVYSSTCRFYDSNKIFLVVYKNLLTAMLFRRIRVQKTDDMQFPEYPGDPTGAYISSCGSTGPVECQSKWNDFSPVRVNAAEDSAGRAVNQQDDCGATTDYAGMYPTADDAGSSDIETIPAAETGSMNSFLKEAEQNISNFLHKRQKIKITD